MQHSITFTHKQHYSRKKNAITLDLLHSLFEEIEKKDLEIWAQSNSEEIERERYGAYKFNDTIIIVPLWYENEITIPECYISIKDFLNFSKNWELFCQDSSLELTVTRIARNYSFSVDPIQISPNKEYSYKKFLNDNIDFSTVSSVGDSKRHSIFITLFFCESNQKFIDKNLSQN